MSRIRVGDLLYFAPGIRFSEIDLDGPGLPRQFERRLVGLYIDAADRCSERGFAFAAGVLLVTCIDALARLRSPGERVGARYTRFLAEELPAFSDPDVARKFYEHFRNGLVHEARVKSGGEFSLERDHCVERFGDVLLVNPQRLAKEVRAALESFICLLENDARERQKLAAVIRAEFADDLRIAQD